MQRKAEKDLACLGRVSSNVCLALILGCKDEILSQTGIGKQIALFLAYTARFTSELGKLLLGEGFLLGIQNYHTSVTMNEHSF